MDDALYQQWWPLHLRVALGEQLDAEEKARYEAGLRTYADEYIKFVFYSLRY